MITVSAAVPAAGKAEAAAVAATHGMSMAALLRELLARVATRDSETLACRVGAGLEPLTPFDPAEHLTTAEAVAVFLAYAAATADPAYIEHAHHVAARARTMHGLVG
jgi:hypothetical protein